MRHLNADANDAFGIQWESQSDIVVRPALAEFWLLGKAIELPEAECLERRVAALEAAARLSSQSNLQL